MIEFVFMLTHDDETVPHARCRLRRGSRRRPSLRRLQRHRRDARGAARDH